MSGTTDKKPILLSWSSGKDSAWTLHRIRRDPRFELRGLITTVNQQHRRVAMHAVRESLLQRQAGATGLALRTVEIPHPCSDAEYQRCFDGALRQAKDEGIEAIAFGDIFLEDIRAYRERQLEPVGLEPVFPLWGSDTGKLAREIVDGGLRAVLTCIDPERLPRSFAGRRFDHQLLDDLPDGADPCGENGEFHSFTFDGPIYDAAIPVRTGEVVQRGGFVFCDLLPAEEER